MPSRATGVDVAAGSVDAFAFPSFLPAVCVEGQHCPLSIQYYFMLVAPRRDQDRSGPAIEQVLAAPDFLAGKPVESDKGAAFHGGVDEDHAPV